MSAMGPKQLRRRSGSLGDDPYAVLGLRPDATSRARGQLARRRRRPAAASRLEDHLACVHLAELVVVVVEDRDLGWGEGQGV